MYISFSKLQGLGNDFILIDERKKSFVRASLAKKLCDRHFGIGADQILSIKKTKKAKVKMEVWNADGSRSSMCGNGIRAVALWLKPKKNQIIPIETQAGVFKVKCLKIDPSFKNGIFNVVLGVPHIHAPGPTLKGGIRISVGNPHVVFFLKKNQTFKNASLLPQKLKANVEFVKVLKPHTIQVRVWERGSGETLACGTGACASAVSFLLRQKKSSRDFKSKKNLKVVVQLPGGRLNVFWKGPQTEVSMQGEAVWVYNGLVRV